MVIATGQSFSHWNYFLALEADLAALARYVEFVPPNFATYSIELAHLMLASASEVDVVMKLLCSQLGRKADSIGEYRNVVLNCEPHFPGFGVSVPRFGLEFKPWDNWQSGEAPLWWSDHNKVKHHRGAHFDRANLKNVLNALGGLFITLLVYYRQGGHARLVPAPSLFGAPSELATKHHALDGETGLFLRRTSPDLSVPGPASQVPGT